MRVPLDSNLLVRVTISPLGRIRIGERFPVSDLSVKRFLERLARASENVVPDPCPGIIADPKDQAVIEAAISGRADVLCTLDRHFYAPEVLEFCPAHGVQVMTDVDLLRLLRGRQ